ncbi:MAG: hypothetical protein CVV02_05685 [Firmicutes bacterium HGW-Firmicutes-7]|nr:MAG: hypothetical protein CVV02_05685 [Firmicutes bacterium HGW-Firmicutes-7]
MYDIIKKELKCELIDPLKTVSQDVIELSIDSLLEDGLLKDVPIVNTILAVAKFGNGIRERFFLKKSFCFWSNFEKLIKQVLSLFNLNAEWKMMTSIRGCYRTCYSYRRQYEKF